MGCVRSATRSWARKRKAGDGTNCRLVNSNVTTTTSGFDAAGWMEELLQVFSVAWQDSSGLLCLNCQKIAGLALACIPMFVRLPVFALTTVLAWVLALLSLHWRLCSYLISPHCMLGFASIASRCLHCTLDGLHSLHCFAATALLCLQFLCVALHGWQLLVQCLRSLNSVHFACATTHLHCAM